MKERPILFNAEMVRAILDGKKTQTRRVMKPQPKPHPAGGHWWPSTPFRSMLHVEDELQNNHEWAGLAADASPFGNPGDQLWVRETHQYVTGSDPGLLIFKAGYDAEDLRAQGFENVPEIDEITTPWKPSIHMRRGDSRIQLEVASVRVERVQEISRASAIAEGVTMDQVIFKEGDDAHNKRRDYLYENYGHPIADVRAISEEGLFQELWDSINSKRGFGWDVNPWVWVVEFKVI